MGCDVCDISASSGGSLVEASLVWSSLLIDWSKYGHVLVCTASGHILQPLGSRSVVSWARGKCLKLFVSTLMGHSWLLKNEYWRFWGYPNIWPAGQKIYLHGHTSVSQMQHEHTWFTYVFQGIFPNSFVLSFLLDCLLKSNKQADKCVSEQRTFLTTSKWVVEDIPGLCDLIPLIEYLQVTRSPFSK